MSEIEALLNAAYEAFEGHEGLELYMARHGIESAGILTVYTDEVAAAITDYLEPRIAGKTVVEIGGGIGLLAMHLGTVAKRVYTIEACPIWASSFIETLLSKKPKNVSYLFGAADEFTGTIRADIALFCTHSGLRSMKAEAAKFAPIVIDVYGEILAKGKFDPLACLLRRAS